MSIKLSDSIRVGQQKPLEDKYFNELVPYTSINQVNTLLPEAIRHRGLTVNINGEEYWYKDGIEDSNLVLKSNSVDTSNLVPYTGATQDVNIASNYFNTSKGFVFTYDENNYFKTYYSSSYNHLGFYSEDSSNDNFGYMFIEANPEIGFVVNIANGDGIYNSFHATESRTYSEKPFVSSEGFIKTGGTANQALRADGGVFDLNSKADLVGGKVPSSQLPSYVDDVLEFANLASFPATGESGKIYIAIDTNLTYRWGGSSYVVMSSSLALGETSSTAYRGDYGKAAYDHSRITTGNPHNTTKTDIGLGNVPNIDATNPANITQTSSYRFVTDSEKAIWNGKQNVLTNPITGTGTTNYIPKFTNTGTLGNSLIYDNGTNVGIGTESPTAKLEVNGNVKANSFIKSGGTSTQILMADGSVVEKSTIGNNQTLSTSINNNGRYLSISGGNQVSIDSRLVHVLDSPNRNPNDPIFYPNVTGKSVRFDFISAGHVAGTGIYAGLMTFSPWDGTTNSTGDSSYQLAFYNQTGIDGTGIPGLKIRKGIDTTWNSWYKIYTDGDFSQSNIDNWNDAVTKSSNQTITGVKTFNTNIGINEGCKIHLRGVNDPSHYISYFNDGTEGFGSNIGFSVKAYNNQDITYFKATPTNSYVNDNPIWHSGNFNPNDYAPKNTPVFNNKIVIRDNALEDNGTDALSAIAINYAGYNGGYSQYRHFDIYDGKGNAVANFNGQNKSLNLVGNLTANSLVKNGGTSSQILMADGNTIEKSTIVDGYALATGTNATDNWSNTSSGLALNPNLSGKTLNASGQTVHLRDATYGQISGIVQDNTNGPIINDWSNRLKTLHNNSAGYFTELAQSFTGTEGVWHRRNSAGTISPWKQLYDDSIWNAASLSYSGSTLTLTINGISKTATINAGSGVSFTGSGSDSGSLALRKSDGTLAYHTGIYNTGSSLYAASFYETSLRKYKINIEQFNKFGLDLINKLDIVTFDKIDGPKDKIGIIADDSPEEFLSENKDAVDLYNTIFIQAKAIQELSETNNMLQTRIERLEEEIQNLRDLLILKLNK